MDMRFDGKSNLDYGLDLQSYAITAAKRKQYLVDVPGGDGQLDLYKGMFPARYEPRTLTAVFRPVGNNVWQIVDDLVNALEGHYVNIVMPDKPNYYMTGSVHIASAGCKPDEDITVTAVCMPWRYAAQEIVLQIQESDAEVQYTWYNNGTREAVPTVTVTGEALITAGTTSLALSAGTYQLTPLTIPGYGSITVSISGGPVEVRYREAVL